MNFRGLGVPTLDKLPLLDRLEILLPLDHDDLVSPNGIFEGLNVGI
jgi:hypothetical protein